MLQLHQPALQSVQRLDVCPSVALDENLVLDLLQLGLQIVQHREVAIDDVVDQRVEHERRAVAQEIGLTLGARAHGAEADLRAVTHREHVVGTDEDIDFADQELLGAVVVLHFLDRLQDGEQRIAVLLDLRALVTLARVLDGELVEAELERHLVQLLARGLEQRNPDEAVRTADVFADVLNRDVGDLAALLVRDAADQHGMNGPYVSPGIIAMGMLYFK